MIKLKKIPGFCKYYVSNTGNIYSIYKPIKKLTPIKDKDGYLIVCLHNNKKQTNKKPLGDTNGNIILNKQVEI